MPLPGDDLVPSPVVQTTHAVTINAAPRQVWPWLVQTGQGRAGFYSDSRFWDRSVDWYYRRLSRQQPGKPAVGYHVAADERIVPAWQNPRVGDIIADGPPGTACHVVRQAEPGKSWVLFTDTHLRYLLPARLRDNPRLGVFGELSDSFLLAGPEPGKTRLIRRMRLRCGPGPFRAYVVPIVLISGSGTGDAGTVNPQMRGEPGNPGPPRMRVLLSVALRGRRSFLGAKQRLGCLEHVLGELPVGGEQLLGEVVGAGRELLGLGQLVAVGQVRRRDGCRDRLDGVGPELDRVNHCFLALAEHVQDLALDLLAGAADLGHSPPSGFVFLSGRAPPVAASAECLQCSGAYLNES